ncbi:MAG TPA: hypothetical protein DDW52_17120 [Planctomycetaceae bacterium]|nr:hypothetical protein [Planctomycetaceae bacterium]
MRLDDDRSAQRSGVQLLELVISMTVASILVAGLGTSVFIAGRTSIECTQSYHKSLKMDLVSGQIEHDALEAFQITDWTSNSIALSSLDQNTNRYHWEGAGHPLNGNQQGVTVAITEPLSKFSVEVSTRSVIPSSPPRPANDYHYEEAYFTSTPLGTSLVGRPLNNMQDGDLLLAVVAVRNANPDTITAQSGWTRVLSERNTTSGIGLAAFYRFSPATSSPVFAWSGLSAGSCIVVLLRTPGCALVDSQSLTGVSARPECPASTFPVSAQGCVIRAIVSRASIYNGTTGMLGFSRVGINHDPLSGYCLGVVWRSTATPQPAGHFTLQSSGDFVTSTMVFQ